MSFYRLEILPSEEGREFYKDIKNRPDDNAGFDLFVVKDTTLDLGGVSESSSVMAYLAMLDLGCRCRMLRVDLGVEDKETEVHFWLAPRSSIWKSGVMMANSMGIIDKSYRGPLMGTVVPLPKATEKDPHIKRGQRLFQILAPDMGHIKEVRIVDSLPETQRGEGGFGSTGK